MTGFLLTSGFLLTLFQRSEKATKTLMDCNRYQNNRYQRTATREMIETTCHQQVLYSKTIPKKLVGILYLLQQHPKLFHLSNTPSVPQTHNELVGLAAGNYIYFNHNRGQVIANTTILARAMDFPKKFFILG